MQITPQKVLECHGKHTTKGPGNLWINIRKGPGVSWKTHHNRSWKLVDKHKRSWKLSIVGIGAYLTPSLREGMCSILSAFACVFRRVSLAFIVLMSLVFTAETVRELIPLYCLEAMRMIRYLSFYVSLSLYVTVSLSLCLPVSVSATVSMSINQSISRSTEFFLRPLQNMDGGS